MVVFLANRKVDPRKPLAVSIGRRFVTGLLGDWAALLERIGEIARASKPAEAGF